MTAVGVIFSFFNIFSGINSGLRIFYGIKDSLMDGLEMQTRLLLKLQYSNRKNNETS